jgi:hypothetical protein
MRLRPVRDEHSATMLCRRLAVVALLPLLLGACTAESSAPAPAGKERAVTIESVPGRTVKRVVLSARAVERLDVQTGEIAEQAIVPTVMVGGVVVDASAASATGVAVPARPAAGGAAPVPETWIRVQLSPIEHSKLAKDAPAGVEPLATRTGGAWNLTAVPSGLPPVDNARSGMLTLFYVVRGEAGGLSMGDRVRVGLRLEGGADRRKVVPYSAVYYDAKGAAWVYVNTAPRAFVRERITVDRVVGAVALLAEGPAVGTRVATVGVPLLYGAEVFGK